ncbi:small-conductance mechanosensitive channel [Anaerobacillus alkaliphilus]|uniref:Small-conductance mechanosensitive channel n=1 Tax=Anaerobacillus alkaliphilus TaxID=1548597 RepID=A0A4Q0VNY8_9BACI|nr:small-conductance mechanosensitive channel [Anaerobacillus alkaliphilus]RXI97819.1 small-conductance mechanosensitive channel [Anaerobacillus alkaliphilus]
MEGVKKEDTTILPSSENMEFYYKRAHFWGRTSIWIVIILSLLLPLYLSFILGYHPGWKPIIAGYLAYAALMGLAWTMEPVMYYPTLGTSGTYLAFLTGNISNMCLPSAAAAQNSVGAEPGTKKGEIAATLGIGAASLVNIAILLPIIFLGSYLLSILPETIYKMFEFILPAIFGGIVGQFAIKKPLFGVVGIVTALSIHLLAPAALQNIFVSLLVTITLCVYLNSKLPQNG